MAIAQKHKVEFTVTTTMSLDVEHALSKELDKMSKVALEGATHYAGVLIDSRQKCMLALFAKGGMEAVASFLVRHTIREAVRELSGEYSSGATCKFSPAIIRKVRV